MIGWSLAKGAGHLPPGGQPPGLWDHLRQAGIPFKAHWGKLNFMDYAFVCDHFALDRFTPFNRPIFLISYLEERLSPPG